MSTDAAPSAINAYSALISTADWTSFEEACEHNSDMKSWSNDIKTIAEKALKSHQGGEGLSIHSLKPITEHVLLSNKAVVGGISTFKDRLKEMKGVSEVMKEAHEEMANSLGDEYIKMSSCMMDFLSEMERFTTLCWNSQNYVALKIQQYFKMPTDKRDAEYYKLIVEKLKELKGSNNVFDHSPEGLLAKIDDFIKQLDEMVPKLKDEIEKFELAEERALAEEAKSWNWKHITSMILICVAVGITIAVAAVACVVAPPVALAIGAIAMPIAGGVGAFAGYLWNEVDRQTTNILLEEDKSRRKETRIVIRELGNIKSSIESVINDLDSLLYQPDSSMDYKRKDEIDIAMKGIEGKLDGFKNDINELKEKVDTCKKDIQKSRQEVYT